MLHEIIAIPITQHVACFPLFKITFTANAQISLRNKEGSLLCNIVATGFLLPLELEENIYGYNVVTDEMNYRTHTGHLM